MPLPGRAWYTGDVDTLTDDQIRARLTEELPGWQLDDGAIHRTYELASFRDAIAFIDLIAAKAEAADHHPDLRNSYRTVEVRLTTHSAGGVTEADLALAREIDGVDRGDTD